MSCQREQGEHSPRLEAVIQKLEESLLHSDDCSGEGTLALRGDGQESSVTPTPVSMRIRQIITRNLAQQPAGESCEVSELEERRALREQLSPRQMDRDQPPGKHASLTDRLDQMLMLQDSDQESSSPRSLQLQNKERVYSQKLQLYQEAQQRQAQLVQKLQTKVLQYKRRSGELEEQVLEKTSESEKMRLLLQAQLDSAQRHQRTEQDLNTAIQNKSAQLEEEQKRCASLSQVNSVLREHLEQAGASNQGLTESLWKAREDAELRDTRLRREQETCASRLSREQARVRALWRQASSLQSTFTQLRTFTDRTLSDMRGECAAASQQLHVTCVNLEARVTQENTSGGVELSGLERQLKDKLKEAMQLQGRWDAEKVDLNSRILELSDTVKHLRSQNSEKDASLTTMQISLDRMETRRTEDKAEMEALRTEIQDLQKILCHVHQLVGGEGDGGFESVSSPLHGRSPLRKTTLMAVQTALSKHQKQTQDLHGCLDAALEQVDTLRHHLQEREIERRELEQKIQEVEREMQEAKKASEESLRESNRYCRSLELISSEKASLEKLLAGLQQEVDSQRAELEALRGMSLELQRQRDSLRQQREDLEMQLTRQRTEAQRGNRSLEELEGKHSYLRRELVTVKESLNQITLQKEVLEDDKASLALALTKMESQSAAQEVALTKLQNQEAALKDSLSKMAALSEGLAKDKVELNRILLQTEGEKAKLDERRREAEADRTVAREETARVQQEIMNLLTEKQALESSHSHLQNHCQKLQAELRLLQREKAQALEQHSQVNRQMQAVSEELCACRKELETQTTALKRATHDREELAKDKAALDVRLNTADRKACGLTQELVALRAEKESLETALFESQELASSLEAEYTRMEGERHGLLLANEALTRDAARMRVDAEHNLAQAAQERSKLEEKLAQVERNAQMTLSNKEQIHREQLEAERRQKEQQCAELMLQREQAEEQLRRQCEELRVHNQQELQQVQEEQARLQQDFNQSLLQAESEKQQALSQKEAEKAALIEKLATLQQDLATADMELEHTKREAHSKHEQDKNVMSVLQSELKDLRTQFEESLNSHENGKKSLTEQVRELNQQSEHAQQELEVLRRQLQEAEDGLIKGRKELIEAHRGLQECAQERDKQRKEVLDLRRLLGDESREKEAIQASNQELRAFIKRAESDNNSLRRSVEEREQKVSVLEECRSSMDQEATTLRSSMRELEKSRLQARRELQELRRQVKILDGENSRQKQELLELQARVCQEEQKEEEARREAFNLKQRVLECEAGREAALNEFAGLQRRLVEMETVEQESRELLQEKEAHQQHSDKRHKNTSALLEEALEDAKVQVQQLCAQVGLAESKVQGMEEQLRLGDAKRKDLELRLAGLYSALRRTVGISHTRLSNTPGSRRRSPSPWRRHVQIRGGESVTDGSVLSLSRGEDEELDVDMVHTALQEIQQELRDAQRHRDEAKAQGVSLSQQVTQLRDSQETSATQGQLLQMSLKQSEQGKREMGERLHEAHISLSLQEEAACRSEREKRSFEEEVAQLRASVQAAVAESRALQDKLELLQGSETLAKAEQRKLKESMEAAESRASRLELSQRTLEGELQRAQLRAAELDAEAGSLQERLTELRRKLGESEDRCAALRVNEERLTTSLARAEQHESHLREQLHKLSETLSDNSSNSGALQEQMMQLQKALTASEHDRKLLQERLDKTRDTLSESKRLNHTLTERTQNQERSQEDLELKNSELEKHNRTLKESVKKRQKAELQAQGSSQQLQRDKEELQDKITNLQSSLQKLQSERAETERVMTRLGKDKSALRKTLEKVEVEKLRREEEAASAAREKEHLGQTVRSLKQELDQKLDELQTLQAQISQVEHSHAQRLLEVTARHHQELDLETDRLRDSQFQAEHALESREKAHRQRVKCLEEQVLTLKEQLEQETRRRHAYFSQMLPPGV
ncbi:rootletin isoform X1 [Hippoglossus hippoglossus]|uniref:rootletin isoform X1 n=1 Tax=Hippoglossus hippoglossus TaxID=8267 RepID=UPI00148B8165|nr:rootletin isoform X1 [Hippoglossus hippoglossus]XP_034438967.1 rootletin isoform X1 [Hippoglossus hippoglossus]